MKRVRLYSSSTPAEQMIAAIRKAMVAIVTYACGAFGGRVVGDDVFEFVTERRQSQTNKARKNNPNIYPYYSCGDLAHYGLYAVGCRNEKLVNQTKDGGEIPWISGVNISRLSGSDAFVAASKSEMPSQGDIIVLVGREPRSEHACVLCSITKRPGSDDTYDITTADYGQKLKRNGEIVDGGILRNQVARWFGGRLVVGSKYVVGFVDLSKVSFSESAIVPDDYDGGVEDDNPYYSDFMDY